MAVKTNFDAFLMQLTKESRVEFNKAVIQAAKDGQKVLKNDTPTGKRPLAKGKRYKQFYTVVPERSGLDVFEAHVWNRKYQLSHLLETSHRVSNQYQRLLSGGRRANKFDSRHPERVYGGDYWANTDWKMWNRNEDYIHEHFTDEVKRAVDRLGKGK